jgi:hypothetical protein
VSFTKNQYQQVLKFVLSKGNTGNIMEALDWDASQFEKGFMLANEMQNLNYAKLLYSNFNKNLIVLELTLVGVSKAQE